MANILALILMTASIRRPSIPDRKVATHPAQSHEAVASSLRPSGRGEVLVGEQAVLHREQAGGCAAWGADLHLDVLDVVGGGLRWDHQSRRDLLARQTPRDQPEHVDLAGRQPSQPLPPRPDA